MSQQLPPGPILMYLAGQSEIDRLQRELDKSGEVIDTQAQAIANLQRELEEALAQARKAANDYCDMITALRERAEKLILHDSDNLDCGCYGCLRNVISQAEASRDAEAQGYLEMRERAEKAEAEVMLDASNRNLRDYAIKQRDEKITALSERIEQMIADFHSATEEIFAITQERDMVLAALKQAYNPAGCGCISDLPGDNYTCTAHQLLFALLDQADPKKADRK